MARGTRAPRCRAGSRAARRDRLSRARPPRLRRLQVGLEAIDVDGVARTRLRSPQLAALEADGVAVLRYLLAGRRVRIGEDEHAVVAIDHAGLVARVAGQARMARGVEVLRADDV